VNKEASQYVKLLGGNKIGNLIFFIFLKISLNLLRIPYKY